jgi:hypothetical protein
MKTRRRRKRYGFMLASAGVLAITSAALCTLWFGAKPNEPARSTGPKKADDTYRKHPAYPYSVVPGGIYSAEEFRDAIARDSVVATHYLVINGSQLRHTSLESSRSAYVSYRVDNAVYWTKRPVKLPSGEAVLSDGESMIRARCGNRVSAFPRLPVLTHEPAEIVADQVGSDPGQEPVPAGWGVPSFDPILRPPVRSNAGAPNPSSGTPVPGIMPLIAGRGTPPIGGGGIAPSGGGGITPSGGGIAPTGGGGTPPIGGGGTPSPGGTGTPLTGGGGTPSSGGGGTSSTGGGGTILTGGGGKPPAGGTGTPPVGGKGTPLDGGGGKPPAGGTGTPPVTGTPTLPVESKGTTPEPGIRSTPAQPGGNFSPPGPGEIPSYVPVTPTVTVVPEPSSWILLGSIALLFLRTLRQRSAARVDRPGQKQ